VAELVAAGAEAADSPAALAARCDVVLSVLVNTEVVEQVVLGPGGVAEGLRPGATFVDMSSISPLVTRRIAERLAVRGVDTLDAPVSGGEVGARDATLVIMVGGPEPVFERVRPIFAALGQSIVRVGEAGAGQVAKACNQLVVGLPNDAVAEALLLARAAGVDPARVREALLGGFAQSRVLDLHGARMLEGRFAPGFRAPLQLKDLAIAAELGAATGQPLPGTETALRLYREMVEAGHGDLDHSGLFVLLEEQGEG
jgi:2-hydroxy-3-oxopropionate reductase